jgi:hypothetical protein
VGYEKTKRCGIAVRRAGGLDCGGGRRALQLGWWGFG